MSHQRILYVEDEPFVAFPVEMVLAEAGYDVAVASNGSRALMELQHGAPVHSLLTDIRLPGAMDGWEIARRARELFPDLPVVYARGDSAKEWKDKGVPRSVMLAKPFSLDAAVDTVRLALNRIGQ
jgi:CheY-like chemotaxis protein